MLVDRKYIPLIGLFAVAGAAVTALCIHMLRECRTPDPQPQMFAADSAAEQQPPEQNGQNIFSVLGEMISPKEHEPDSFIPTVALDTEHYPIFTEAGLDTMVTQNPLCAEGGRYVLLKNSESVILSEPVILKELPHGGAVTLWFSYDMEQAEGLLEHMEIMRFDPDVPNSVHETEFEELRGSAIDGDAQRISITVTEPGVYYVYDADAWARIWGFQTWSPLFYRNPAVGFSFEIPAEIIVNEIMMDFEHIDEQYLPPENRWTDENGARHVKSLEFVPSSSDPGINDFSLEWITGCKSADAAADIQRKNFEQINQMQDIDISMNLLLDQTRELPDGSHCRVLVTETVDRADRSCSWGRCIRAYFDLKPDEIIYVVYSFSDDAPDSLYDTMLSSLDTFRRTGGDSTRRGF